jgi:phage terminase small subunit
MARALAKKECSEAELRFCSEYIKTADTAAAALAGWPAHKYPAKYGRKVLTRPHVLKELARLRTQISAKLDASAERVIAELAKVAFSDIADLLRVSKDGSAELDLTKLTDKTKAALSEYTVDSYVEGRGATVRGVKKHRAKMHDKLKALEILAKHFGILSETVTHKHDHWHMLLDRMSKGRDRMRKQDAIDVEPN